MTEEMGLRTYCVYLFIYYIINIVHKVHKSLKTNSYKW